MGVLRVGPGALALGLAYVYPARLEAKNVTVDRFVCCCDGCKYRHCVMLQLAAYRGFAVSLLPG